MSDNQAASLFDLRFHNPSFFAIKESNAYKGKLPDFCIPVNLHFPPPELLEMVHENLGEILRYYPDYAEVHQEHIAEMTGLDATMNSAFTLHKFLVGSIYWLFAGALRCWIPKVDAAAGTFVSEGYRNWPSKCKKP